ncbi:hypothetical protein QEH56_13425 [Pelagicoccus enzymogenes]|uniref:hypothetical protein n=1 Tax=Pelagicoccus enzymogenes TaxID=2773457 RepID=UPI00280F6FAB|nr:hypothetical protein [Pelagicoccus enzymogenes]MDQ8199163.1 hypothetical protein [Pelagicoccus enzymogenes]
MMRIALALCGDGIGESEVKRARRSLDQYGFDYEIETVLTTAALVETYSEALGCAVEVFKEAAVSRYDALLYYIPDTRVRLGKGVGLGLEQFGFAFSWAGRLEALNEKSRELLKAEDEHHFSRATADRDQFYYFPYGYLYRDSAVGRVNEMGFRVPDDLVEVSKRDRTKEKVVCVFGGSAAFSMNCLQDEMFAARLEILLNESARDGLRYRVYNFGMHGHVMLNEMFSYLLYAERLQPDFVIAHDGFNDLAYGCNSDKLLMEKHSIVFQENLELWPFLLEGREEAAKEHSERFFRVTNFPKGIVESYLERKAQFRSVVERSGARFISAFQPFLSQKATLTAWERRVCVSWTKRNPMRPYFERMGFLFETYLRLRDEHGFSDDLDFRASMSERGDESLFADFVHLRPEGDQMVAEEYKRWFDQNDR